MDDQKIENLLNLALEVPDSERRKSAALSTGYHAADQTWEVIVRSSQNPNRALPFPEHWRVLTLSGGYAIITLPQSEVNDLAALPFIEYVEKPKRLYFSVDAGRAASCISAVQTAAFGLTGEGILTAVIDSGADYFHPDFRNEDGSTRILAIWDQTAEETGRAPEGFYDGAEYTKEEIDAALSAGSREAGLAIVPEQDFSGHGTGVLGIAAGNGRASGGRYRGVATRSGLLVVKLGIPRSDSFPRTTELMKALEYVIRKAEKLRMPVAINISIGNVYGSHRGTSLLETYIDLMAERGRSVIIAGTGNEGNTGGHVSGKIRPDEEEEIEFLINDFEAVMNLQIWKNYADDYRITIVHPDGRSAGPLGQETGASRYRLGTTTLLVYYGEPGPYQPQQEIYLDFIPDGAYIDSGVWRVILTPRRIITGEYSIWMPDGRARNDSTRFLTPSAGTTMTIPSTASRVIAVGAYDARRNAAVSFSGRGWPEQDYEIHPDLAAPGVDITTAAPGGGYVSLSGTSFAAPFVTGSAALLMQWGIRMGNDPFLYGEKVRAYLRRGARQLPGYSQWPNNLLGYGALCVRDSLPV